MVDTKNFTVGSMLIIIFTSFFLSTVNAQSVKTVKLKPYYRESVLNISSDKVINILTNYEEYYRLFRIKETRVHSNNSLHSIVYYKVKIAWKEPAALLRFTEREYGNVFQIDCESIRLYELDALHGQLKIYTLPHNRTKIKIRLYAKPDIFVPNIIYHNTMDRMFDRAIRNLKRIAKSIKEEK